MLIVAAALSLCGCSLFTPAELVASDSLRVWYPEAASVQVIGDWNDWGGLASAGGILDPSCGLMEKDSEGFWSLKVDLERGRYRYAFLVDGFVWMADESNHLRTIFESREVSLLVIGR